MHVLFGMYQSVGSVATFNIDERPYMLQPMQSVMDSITSDSSDDELDFRQMRQRMKSNSARVAQQKKL